MDKLQEFMQTAKLSDYIDLMVKALENPKIKVNMSHYGTVIDGFCFGCAATNALCELSEKVFDETNIINEKSRAEFLGYDQNALSYFEVIIDKIRDGQYFSGIAAILTKFNPATKRDYTYPKLKRLKSDYTLQELIPFKELSIKLKQDGL